MTRAHDNTEGCDLQPDCSAPRSANAVGLCLAGALVLIAAAVWGAW